MAFCVFHRTAKQVFEEIFCGDTTQVSYKWLQYLRHKLLHASCDEKIEYLTKRKLRRNFVKIGRRMLLEPHHDILLAQLVETHNGLTDQQLAILLRRTIGPTFSRISRKQIVIARARKHLTYKKFTRIHILANVDEQILHYEDLAHIDPANFLNFDESYHGKGKWKQLYGKGRYRAIKKEWIIGGKRFSI